MAVKDPNKEREEFDIELEREKLRALKLENEFRALTIEDLKEKVDKRNAEKTRIRENQQRQLEDFEKAKALEARRQARCLHRKGGRNNQFSRGDSNNYSIVRNIYPNGIEEISCTRCGKRVVKPDPRQRKKDPALYKMQLEQWRQWDAMPTDNSASGGKIFEIIPADAA